MKKLGTVVAALVMSFAMAATAFAASPVTVQPETPGVSIVSELTEEQATAVQAAQTKVSTAEQLKEVLGTQFKEGAVALQTLFLDGPDEPTTVTLDVTGINAGDEILVIHWSEDGQTVKEILTATVADGKITFTTNGFSPFTIVRVAAAAGAGATAPKTGEAGTAAAMALIALSAAGIVVLNRKKVA